MNSLAKVEGNLECLIGFQSDFAYGLQEAIQRFRELIIQRRNKHSITLKIKVIEGAILGLESNILWFRAMLNTFTPDDYEKNDLESLVQQNTETLRNIHDATMEMLNLLDRNEEIRTAYDKCPPPLNYKDEGRC